MTEPTANYPIPIEQYAQEVDKYMPDKDGWRLTTIGTLSAFEAHDPGSIVGCEVRLLIDHPGPNHGSTYQGELTAMGRSEFSGAYYHLEITGGEQKVVHKLDLPLSHDIRYRHSTVFAHPFPTDLERRARYTSLDRITAEPEFCSRGTCRKQIQVQIFKGTGYCSTNCYKIANGQSIEQKDNHLKGSA